MMLTTPLTKLYWICLKDFYFLQIYHLLNIDMLNIILKPSIPTCMIFKHIGHLGTNIRWCTFFCIFKFIILNILKLESYMIRVQGNPIPIIAWDPIIINLAKNEDFKASLKNLCIVLIFFFMGITLQEWLWHLGACFNWLMILG